ncbi:MAG: hypothetical protein HDT20_05275 [Oscillibacter sp.]|nr:hypothetical protein [Oscillibacter sp.]
MENFPKYYTRLFNGITDALEALQNQNYTQAQKILIYAQQDAEEMYLEDGDEEGEDEEPGGCYSWEIEPMIRESERLEMQMLLHESDAIFQEFCQMVRQAERPRPEVPTCEKTETE